MTQPDAHRSLALFCERLLGKSLFLPAGTRAAHFSSELKRAGLRV